MASDGGPETPGQGEAGERVPGLAARLELAVAVARAAGEATLEHFGSRHAAVEAKADGSPVTIADREAERLVRERVEAAFAGDAILGEEFGEREGSSGWRWIVDPIDGTTSFVHGVPLYGTLLAVEHRAEPVIGVIEMPALRERVWAGRGRGAWWSRGGGEATAARLSGESRLAGAAVCTTALEYFPPGGEGLLGRLSGRCGVLRGWSDCYAHLLLATGRIDAVVEPLVRRWDVGAIAAILAEQGGRYTDWAGRESIDDAKGLASNGLVHEELLALVSGWA